MKAILEIELIGDDTVQETRFWTKVTNDLLPGIGDMTFGKCPSSGWVAEITDFDPRYKYARNFLRFKKDYSRSNSKGSRGVFAEYILEEGKIYDVKSPETWKRNRRYFCTVRDWKIVEISEEEVIECLNDRLKLTSMKPRSNE